MSLPPNAGRTYENVLLCADCVANKGVGASAAGEEIALYAGDVL